MESRLVRVKDLLDLLVQDYKITGKKTAYDAEKRIDAHLRPHFGHVRVLQFRSSLVDGYIERRRKAGAADSTIERELKLLRRAFSLGEKHEPPLIARSPHIRALKADRVRTGFIEDEQYRKLLKELPDHLKAFFVTGYHLGRRLGTLRQLTWDQVDLEAREITIRADQTKQKRPQTLPVYGDMVNFLKIQRFEHQQRWPDVGLVFHWGKKPLGTHIKGWAEACERAGMPDLHFHDLRRSAVRNMVRAGVSAHIAMSISGSRHPSGVPPL